MGTRQSILDSRSAILDSRSSTPFPGPAVDECSPRGLHRQAGGDQPRRRPFFFNTTSSREAAPRHNGVSRPPQDSAARQSGRAADSPATFDPRSSTLDPRSSTLDPRRSIRFGRVSRESLGNPSPSSGDDSTAHAASAAIHGGGTFFDSQFDSNEDPS
jgi:hypothetical protein